MRTRKERASTDVGSRTGIKHSPLDIRRGAGEIKNYRLLKKILLLSIACIAVFLMIGYALVLIYNRTGRFTVLVDNPDVTFAVSLCEHEDFESRSSMLVNDQQVNMTNICGSVLPKNVNNVDGEHNGSNYLAYTFYGKNVGTAESTWEYEVTFNNVANHLDECMRVRLYVTPMTGTGVAHNVNDGFTDFAKTRSDGKGKETHFCDKAFSGNYVVCNDYVDNVGVGDVVKFTIVIWVEGDDMDCTDSVINGSVKFSMTIEAGTLRNAGENAGEEE